MKKWDVFVFGDINIDLLIPGVSSLPPAGEEWEVPRMRTEPGGGADRKSTRLNSSHA